MSKEAHMKAATCFKDASKQHEEAAKHTEAGNHKDAASCAMQATSHCNEGKKNAQVASDEYTKKHGTK